MKYGKFIEVFGDKAPFFASVAKAVSHDDTRMFMNYAYCDDGKLIATDGRRLHWVELKGNPFGFEQGKFYRALKVTQKITWFAEILDSEHMTFPNWKRVVPEGVNDTMLFENYSPRSRESWRFAALSKLLKWLPDSSGLNFSYIKDLPQTFELTVSRYERAHALRFDVDEFAAVIMPMDMSE